MSFFRFFFGQPNLSAVWIDLEYAFGKNVSYINEYACVCVLNFRWFNEARGASLGENKGILYTASSNTAVGSMENVSSDFDTQIVLTLKREEDKGQNEAEDEWVSGQGYALISESMWLRALKW